MEQIKVLITGVGSGVGLAVFNALKDFISLDYIYGVDIEKFPPNYFLYKNFQVITPLEKKNGLYELLNLAISEEINLIIPGNEFDLEILSKSTEMFNNHNIKIAVSKNETIELTNDKLRTYQYLSNLDIDVPETYLFDENIKWSNLPGNLNFPVVIKPRIGNASKGFQLINNSEELAKISVPKEKYLIQEFLKGKRDELSSEYTCAVFNDAFNNKVGPFSLKRTLRNGTTWIVKHEDFSFLNQYLLSIANRIDYQGPLNIQLIDTDNGPYLLEINCRFSGTTGIRSQFGFNEVKMYINSYLLNKPIPDPQIHYGAAFRYLTELYTN